MRARWSSRATYPCQRASFPLASGFVLWVNRTGYIGDWVSWVPAL